MSINQEEIVLNDNFFNPDHETQSKKQLIANNQRMCEHIKALEEELRNQRLHMNEYQHEIQQKVSFLRQSMDHLYNSNNPNCGNKSNEQNDNDEGLNGVKEMNAKEIKETIEEIMNVERIKWENDKERLRNVHAKQLQELKKKIKDWMEYAKKQEQHAKIYKKQLQNMHKKSKQHGIKTKASKGQIYVCFVLFVCMQCELLMCALFMHSIQERFREQKRMQFRNHKKLIKTIENVYPPSIFIKM